MIELDRKGIAVVDSDNHWLYYTDDLDENVEYAMRQAKLADDYNGGTLYAFIFTKQYETQ